MIGLFDEVRMPLTENDRNPILIDIKTHSQDTLPAGPEGRNGRFVSFHFIVLDMKCHLNLLD